VSSANQAAGSQGRAIAFAVLTAFLFSGSDALSKQLLLLAPFVWLLLLRYVFQLTTLVSWAALKGRRLSPGPWRLQFLRSALLAGSSFSGYLALKHVPLADYTALMMLAPVASVLMGKLVLRESVSHLQWGCVVAGVLGMLAVVRPEFSAVNMPAWAAVMSACCYAGFQMVSRKVMAVADVLSSNIFAAVFMVTLAGVTLVVWPVDWGLVAERLDWVWWLQFALMCAVATGGQVSLTVALQSGALSLVAPFAYLQIVFAVLIGLAFFGHWPDGASFMGMVLIAASGLGSAWLAGRHRPPVLNTPL